MKNIIVVLLLILPLTTIHAQRRRMKKKVSYAEGTIFGYFGYNRSWYTQSDIQFVGPGYDFTLADAKAHDNDVPLGFSNYFDFDNIETPQFNARVGYYFKDHWAISFGFDQMKYILADNNEVFLSGSIDDGLDDNWSGTYNAEPVTTDRSQFHYENSGSLNYMRVELTRTDQWFKTGPRDLFAISTNVGIGAGALLTSTDFTFADRTTDETLSFSGYGVSLHVGPRFEFFRHLFIQTNLNTGLLNQRKAQTRPNDPSSYARHSYGYIAFETVIGALFYIRPKNGCDSCPVW